MVVVPGEAAIGGAEKSSRFVAHVAVLRIGKKRPARLLGDAWVYNGGPRSTAVGRGVQRIACGGQPRVFLVEPVHAAGGVPRTLNGVGPGAAAIAGHLQRTTSGQHAIVGIPEFHVLPNPAGAVAAQARVDVGEG